MPDPNTTERILTDLAFVTDHWNDLLEARQPGTPRPWRQALLDPERRTAMAARDRDERTNRDPDAPGFTSAPEHVDVLDVLVDTWTTLDELTATISPDWRRTRPGRAIPRTAAEHGPDRLTDIHPMADFIRLWLPETDTDPDKLARITRQLAALTTEITRVLGLIRAGQLLTGATCPWCRGVTPHHPAGGATTLRVEEIPARPANQYRPAVEAVPVVVCWNPLCEPSDADCGTRWRGRPAWPWHEWDWLAKRLIIAEQPAIPRTAAVTFWDDPAIYPIVHSGRSGIDQAIGVVRPHDPVLNGRRFSDETNARTSA